MSQAKSPTNVFATFTTKDATNYQECRQFFHSIKPYVKLYVSTTQKYGKIYYNSWADLEYLVKQVKRNNPFGFEFQPLKEHSTDIETAERMQDIDTSISNVVFDTHCNKIAMLRDTSTEETYVSLREATNGGLAVFGSPSEAQEHFLQQVNEFVRVQVEVYLKCVASKYKSSDFEFDIKFRNKLYQTATNSETCAPNVTQKSERFDNKIAVESPQDSKHFKQQNGTPFRKAEPAKMHNDGNMARKSMQIDPPAEFKKDVNPVKRNSGQQIESTPEKLISANGNMARKSSQIDPPAEFKQDVNHVKRNSGQQIEPTPEKLISANGNMARKSSQIDPPAEFKKDVNPVKRISGQQIESTPEKLISAISPKPRMSPMEAMKQYRKMPLPPKKKKLEVYPKARAFVDLMTANNEQTTIEVLKLLKCDENAETASFLAFVLDTEFMTHLETAELNTEILTPTIGEMVLVKTGNVENCSRAYILQIVDDEFKVALIDYGEVTQVKTVYEISPKLKDFEEFTCICTAPVAIVKKYIEDGSLLVTPLKNNLCKDASSDTEIHCIRWMPEQFLSDENSEKDQTTHTTPAKEAQIICTSISSEIKALQIGDMVKIIAVLDGFLHLRSKETHIVLSSLQKLSYDKLENPPKVGQYVMRNEENFWFRCFVENITDKSIALNQIDYCHSISIPHEQFYNLSKDAMFGPTLHKVRLRHFEDLQYSENAHNKLMEMRKKDNFAITFSAGDVIDMKRASSDKQHFSEYLMQLDAPEFFCLSDLPPVPELTLNEEITIVVTHATSEEIFFPFDAASEPSVSDMTAMETVEDIAEGQLCSAPYEGEWYRGEVKTLNSDGKHVDIHFIDFGNTESIEKTLIKPFPDDMLQIAPVVIKAELTSDSCDQGIDTIGKVFSAVPLAKDGNKYKIRLVELVEIQ